MNNAYLFYIPNIKCSSIDDDIQKKGMFTLIYINILKKNTLKNLDTLQYS